MENHQIVYKNLLLQEIKSTPEEYLPALLNIVQLFRESVTLKTAEASFTKGWEETMAGEVNSIDDLWTGIDAE